MALSSRSLLKSLNNLIQLTNIIRMFSILETKQLCHIGLFLKLSIKKCIIYILLMSFSLFRKVIARIIQTVTCLTIGLKVSLKTKQGTRWKTLATIRELSLSTNLDDHFLTLKIHLDPIIFRVSGLGTRSKYCWKVRQQT